MPPKPMQKDQYPSHLKNSLFSKRRRRNREAERNEQTEEQIERRKVFMLKPDENHLINNEITPFLFEVMEKCMFSWQTLFIFKFVFFLFMG